jgi:hypothetical protein
MTVPLVIPTGHFLTVLSKLCGFDSMPECHASCQQTPSTVPVVSPGLRDQLAWPLPHRRVWLFFLNQPIHVLPEGRLLFGHILQVFHPFLLCLGLCLRVSFFLMGFGQFQKG